ncbi:MAG: hypothetical protein ACT4OX_16155 [Actinomycetota bacterium]
MSFHTVGDLEERWIEDYMRAAVDHAGLNGDIGDGGTTVRVSAGPKRKPG